MMCQQQHFPHFACLSRMPMPRRIAKHVRRARGGRKKEVLDIFGSWAPMEDFSVAAMRQASLPNPLVNADDILEWNFDWGPDRTIPYETFDALRVRHNIDVTGLNLSLTHRGNLYRSYALLRGPVG